jgi:hypothetical protein
MHAWKGIHNELVTCEKWPSLFAWGRTDREKGQMAIKGKWDSLIYYFEWGEVVLFLNFFFTLQVLFFLTNSLSFLPQISFHENFYFIFVWVNQKGVSGIYWIHWKNLSRTLWYKQWTVDLCLPECCRYFMCCIDLCHFLALKLCNYTFNLLPRRGVILRTFAKAKYSTLNWYYAKRVSFSKWIKKLKKD